MAVESGLLVDSPAPRVDDRLMQHSSILDFDWGVKLICGKTKGSFFGGLRGDAFKALLF
jgi:hypothetical protein